MPSVVYVPLVAEQPTAAIMDPNQLTTEKPAHCCQGCVKNIDDQEHHHLSHNSRLRRLIFPTALALLVLIAGLFTLSCLYEGHVSDWSFDELLARATSSGSTNSSPFVKNKLYLIVLFVGIVVVIGLGIALSFWCCRGSFENPLCCPCYLCACCGGLVCLECIGCGLCAEAIDQA